MGPAARQTDATARRFSTEPARIRAYFAAPAHARKGIGTLLLEKRESEARRREFSRVELLSTRSGVRLYRCEALNPTPH